jgi:dynein heavy chain
MLKKNMDEFKRTMALLPDLRDESMRTRHWNMLRLEVKEEFNEKSDDFTLEEVFKLRFLEYENDIISLTDEAKKQLKVEKDLLEIKRVWEDDPASDLFIVKEKSKADQEEFFKIGSTDNIMVLIEEHTVTLATHKASPFYK